MKWNMAGVAEDLFDAMSIFAGKLRGGVAIQTIAVAVVLAAMSGVIEEGNVCIGDAVNIVNT